MRDTVIAPLLLIAACSSCTSKHPNYPDTDVAAVADDAQFAYHGKILRFPVGTVDARIDKGGLGPWARLVPDAPPEHEVVKARYYIDLGRPRTGTKDKAGTSMWLGFNSYAGDAIVTSLPKGYQMWCSPPQRATPAFDCAVLLKALPFAAIAIKDRPTAANASSLVQDAERYLTKAVVAK